MPIASILWRRLDTPGHDGCRLEQSGAGWLLEGTAVFRENGSPAWLTYYILYDPTWRTTLGKVQGWLGGRSVDFRITRTGGGVWTLNGTVIPGFEAYVDLDLGFTPATNLTQLRRVALAEGQAADIPVAWLDVASGMMSVLPQRYERRSEDNYWYEAPSVSYQGLLEVCSNGFIRRYPGLWEAEP